MCVCVRECVCTYVHTHMVCLWRSGDNSGKLFLLCFVCRGVSLVVPVAVCSGLVTHLGDSRGHNSHLAGEVLGYRCKLSQSSFWCAFWGSRVAALMQKVLLPTGHLPAPRLGLDHQQHPSFPLESCRPWWPWSPHIQQHSCKTYLSLFHFSDFTGQCSTEDNIVS